MSAVFRPQFSGGGFAVFAAQESYPNNNPVLQGAITVTNITTSSYDLAWPPATGLLPTTDYEVSLNGGVSWVSNGLALTRSVTGRPQNTTDNVQVRAKVAGTPDLYSSPPLATTVTLQPVIEPPTVAVLDTVVSGQSVTISGTYAGTVDDAVAVLPVGDPANGAVAQGPVPVTYAAGAWEVSFDDLVPGSYSSAIITFSNGGGDGVAYGSAFEVLGFEGTPEAPVPGGGNFDTFITEVTGSTDTSTRSITTGTSVGETATAADTTSVSVTMGRQAAESAAPVDAVSQARAALAAVSEVVPATDSSTKIRDTVATMNEGAGANPTDSPVAQVTVGLFTPESAVVVDAQAGATAAVSGVSEALVVTDAAQAVYSAIVAVAEAGAAADGASQSVSTGLLVVELASATEVVDATVQQIVGFANEVMVLTDTQYKSLLAQGAVTEAVAIADNVDAISTLTATTVAEALQAVDTAWRLRYPGSQVSYAPRGNARRFIVFFK